MNSRSEKQAQHHAIVDDHHIRFPDTLDNCILVDQPLGGGTKSAFLLKDPSTNNLFVLKLGAHPEALKMEMLFHAIYHVLDVPVPNMHVYYLIPTSLQNKLGICNGEGYFKLSEYVIADTKDNLSETIRQAINDFIIHVFVGNTDIKPANYVKRKLIDTGSNFMYRGLGEARYDLSHILDELWKLKSPSVNPIGCEWFQAVDYRMMREQAADLLKKSYLVERTVRDESMYLGISDSLHAIILDKSSVRLDMLIRYFFANEHPKAKPQIRANSQTTAAGTLFYRMINGKMHVLLSKRAKHRWWGTVGGTSADEDFDLADTATRESYEETSGQTRRYAKNQVNKATSHVSTKINKDGSYSIFCLYIMENPGININAIHDQEHTEHRDVPLEEVISALKNPTIKEEEIETCTVLDKNHEPMILYPPFYQMLMQPAMKQYLYQLIANNLVPGQHTQSLVLEDRQNEDKSFSTHKVHNFLATSKDIKSQQIGTVIKHSNLLRELKSNLDIPIPLSITTNSLTQNRQHLKLLLKDKYIPHQDRINIINVCRDKAFYIVLNAREKQHLVATCARFIINEQSLGTQYKFLIHGCNAKASYSYLVYLKMCQYLFIQNGHVAFRINQKYLSKFKDVPHFIRYFTNDFSTQIDNSELFFTDSCSSTNPFIFGNLNLPTSFSLKYFINNDSTTEIDIGTIFTELLTPLHIEPVLIQKLIDLFNKVFAHFGGALYHIQLSKEEAEKYCYPAKSRGQTHLRNQSLNLADILSDFLQLDLDKIDDETKQYYLELQARLILTSTQAFKADYVYWHEPSHETKHAAMQQLESIVQEIVQSILTNINNHSSNTICLTTPLLRITSLWQNHTKSTDEKTNTLNALANAIYQNDANEFRNILEKNPNAYSIIQKDSFTKKSACAFILKNKAFSLQDLTKFLGKDWWESYPFKTDNEFYCLINKISDQTEFCNMQNAIFCAIESLPAYHFFSLHSIVTQQLTYCLHRIKKDKFQLDIYLAVIKLAGRINSNMCSNKWNSMADTVKYLLSRLDKNISQTDSMILLEKLIESSCVSSFNFLTKRLIITDELQTYIHALTIEYFNEQPDTIANWIEKNPLLLDYINKRNNSLLHLIMRYAHINQRVLSYALNQNQDYFFKENNNQETVVQLLVKKYFHQATQEDDKTYLATLFKHLSAHKPIYLNPELASLAAKHYNQFIFEWFSSITHLNTSELTDYFRRSTDNEKLLIINHIAEHHLSLDETLSVLILNHISLIRIFSVFSTDQIMTIIKFTRCHEDINQFLIVFRQILEINHNLLKLDISFKCPNHRFDLLWFDIEENELTHNMPLLKSLLTTQKKVTSICPADHFKPNTYEKEFLMSQIECIQPLINHNINANGLSS